MQIKSMRNRGQNILTDHHQREDKILCSSNTYCCFFSFLFLFNLAEISNWRTGLAVL